MYFVRGVLNQGCTLFKDSREGVEPRLRGGCSRAHRPRGRLYNILCSRGGLLGGSPKFANLGNDHRIHLYWNEAFWKSRKQNHESLYSKRTISSWRVVIPNNSIVIRFLGCSKLYQFISQGMSLLTLAVSMPSLKPPPCLEPNIEHCKPASKLHLAVFFTALYTLALGTGGTKPNISTIGADQFDDFHPEEKAQKLSFFNWWMFSIFFGTLFATTTLVYIQDNVGWSLGYGIPTVGLAIAILIFAAGTPLYRHKLPTGSPFSRMAKVIVATAWNWRQPLPNDPRQLHELQLEEYTKNGAFRIDSTPSLRSPISKIRITWICICARIGVQ